MMRTYRGIVCEKNKNDMIFMTDKGEFLRGIPINQNAEIGEEVEFQLVATPPLRSKKLKPLFIAPVIIAATLMIFLVSTLFSQPSNVYAYIQLEGKTSIELGIDEKGNVISATSNNKDLQLDDWEGLPVDEVIPQAIKKIAPKDEEINITTEYENQNHAELKSRIENAVKEVKQKPSPVDREFKQKTTPVVEDEIQTKEKKSVDTNEGKGSEQPPKTTEKNNENQSHEKSNNGETNNKLENNSKQNEEKQHPTKNKVEKEQPNKPDKQLEKNNNANPNASNNKNENNKQKPQNNNE